MCKSAILEIIRENKPELIPLPDLSVFHHNISETDLIADFIRISTESMSNVVNIINSEIQLDTYLKEFIAKNYPTATIFYDTLNPKENLDRIDFQSKTVDLFIAESKLGVSENGCLWLDERILKQRISAFACQHTLLIIDHKNIVPTMHQAYQKLKIEETGYGVFISGPSKTADIEQSLVIGAQGAISNTIILI
jgi:L-lactate dehydrogenase complex protein LldG